MTPLERISLLEGQDLIVMVPRIRCMTPPMDESEMFRSVAVGEVHIKRPCRQLKLLPPQPFYVFMVSDITLHLWSCLCSALRVCQRYFTLIRKRKKPVSSCEILRVNVCIVCTLISGLYILQCMYTYRWLFGIMLYNHIYWLFAMRVYAFSGFFSMRMYTYLVQSNLYE